MQFVKALIGGLIGGAIGTAIYFYVNKEGGPPMPWAALIVGVLAGVGVRLSCGVDRSLVTGVTAAIATLATLLGYQYYTSSMVQTAETTIKNVRTVKDPVKAAPPKVEPEQGTNEDGDAEDGDAEDGDAEANGDDNTGDNGDGDTTEEHGDDDAEDHSHDDATDDHSHDDATDDHSHDDPPKLADTSKPAGSNVAKASAPIADANKPIPRAKLDKRARNEGIAFGIAGLLAYAIGRGDGKPRSVQTTEPESTESES